jgi:hypothetical protein
MQHRYAGGGQEFRLQLIGLSHPGQQRRLITAPAAFRAASCDYRYGNQSNSNYLFKGKLKMAQVTSTHTGNQNNVHMYIMLYDGDNVYTASAAFYTAVRLQVEEVIPGMERGVKYTLEMLCGDAFWRTLSDGEKRMAGRCMAHMVVNKRLPLCFAESKHEYPKWYELIQH